MTILRQMTWRDIRQVNLILSKAFTHAHLQDGFRSRRVPLCRSDFLEMYRAANPEGAFVFEKEYTVIAYCFTRIWGRTGWVGPLSVLPSHSGKGYGKRIVQAAVDFLKQRGATTIGLEMSAHSTKNLAFYTRLGFEPAGLVVDLIRPLSGNKVNMSREFEILKYRETLPSQKDDFFENLKSLSQRIDRGLDYSQEIATTSNFDFGDACLVMKSNVTIGFILAHTETYSTEEKRQFLKVNALQMAPEMPTETLGDFLAILENWAEKENLTGIYMRVPTRYARAFAVCLEMGFSVVRNDLRMTLRGFEQNDNCNLVNFSKWE